MHFSKRQYLALGGAVLLVAALAIAASVRLHRPDPVTVPGQTPIHVRLNQSVTTERSRPGDHFTATVTEPIVVDNKMAVPAGAQVRGRVIDAQPSGRLKGRARLGLVLETVDLRGTTYEIHTASARRVSGSHKKRNIGFIAGGAGGGTLIGAIAAGGKGALIGGPIGAGAGTAVAYFTGRKDVRLPAETPLTFRLAEPLTVNMKT